MLRRDFVSKIIEEFANAISRMLKLDYIEDKKKFLLNFEESLQTYFQIPSEELNLLLQDHEERDVFLLDEKLKNHLMSLFIRAGLAFINENELEKAKFCLKIIKRIQIQHSTMYEFPNEDTLKISVELAELKEKLSNKGNI